MQVELGAMAFQIMTDVEIDIRVRASNSNHCNCGPAQGQSPCTQRVSNLLCGNSPTLVVTDRLRWRVPVWLGFPKLGMVGKVGEIDVDVETGEMLFDETTLRGDPRTCRRTCSTYPICNRLILVPAWWPVPPWCLPIWNNRPYRKILAGSLARCRGYTSVQYPPPGWLGIPCTLRHQLLTRTPGISVGKTTPNRVCAHSRSALHKG